MLDAFKIALLCLVAVRAKAGSCDQAFGAECVNYFSDDSCSKAEGSYVDTYMAWADGVIR
jgi:hypothetical protein